MFSLRYLLIQSRKSFLPTLIGWAAVSHGIAWAQGAGNSLQSLALQANYTLHSIAGVSAEPSSYRAQAEGVTPGLQESAPQILDVMDLDPTDAISAPQDNLPTSLQDLLTDPLEENLHYEDLEGLEAESRDEDESSDNETDEVNPETEEPSDNYEFDANSDLPEGSPVDDELGILRLRPVNAAVDPELGVLRVQAIEDLPLEEPPEAPAYSTGFITAQTSFFGGTNIFRAPIPLDERVFQAGAGLFIFPKLSSTTNLLAGVEGNLVRYTNFPNVSYNEIQFQAGIRQRLSERMYGQLSWRNQKLYNLPGNTFFSSDYAELLLSRRDILNSRLWLDSYYQMRFSFSDPDVFSRFSQVLITALNYGFTPQFRSSLIYQLFLDDYTTIERYDTYHQVIGQLSYDLNASSRLSLFGGVKFGRSSSANVNFDDLIYGFSFNFNLPVF